MELSEERRAYNQTVFRDANESIAEKASGGFTGDRIPFLCECPDPACTALIRIPSDEYAAIRSHPRHFLCCPGHESDGAVVVRSGAAYCVFEKTGVGGEIAEERALQADERPS